MANKKFLWGMLVMALAFSLAVIGCPNDTDDSSSSGTFPTAKGKLTINGLSSYDGKYVYVGGSVGEKTLHGVISATGDSEANSSITLAKISGGKAEVPLYEGSNMKTMVAYEGNDSLDAASYLFVYILDDSDGKLTSSEMSSAMSNPLAQKQFTGTFSKGNLTVSW